MKKLKVSFPLMGNYHIPISYFLKHVMDADIMLPPPITVSTLELGTKYSPDFVCIPFKYTLGTFIEELNLGANVLIQAGGGCRYGYYSELQEKILKDLGYDFIYINLVSKGVTDYKKIISEFRKIDKNVKVYKMIYYALITRNMIKYMDRIEDYIRYNECLEKKCGSMKKLENKMFKDFKKVNNPISLFIKYIKYKLKFKLIKKKKSKNTLKIGIIGELYTLMEPFSNYELENFLIKNNIRVKRFTNVYYLLFEKSNAVKKYLKKINFIKYPMGADAFDNIARTKYLINKKYDGIIHIKSSFCTPEIGAMPVINKLCEENNMPVIFFSFDSNTSDVGIKTRLEAFYDLIERKKNHDKLLPRD